jgi:hypothetical protein
VSLPRSCRGFLGTDTLLTPLPFPFPPVHHGGGKGKNQEKSEIFFIFSLTT